VPLCVRRQSRRDSLRPEFKESSAILTSSVTLAAMYEREYLAALCLVGTERPRKRRQPLDIRTRTERFTFGRIVAVVAEREFQWVAWSTLQRRVCVFAR